MRNICESMEAASCHPSGTKNSKMPSRFLENLCSSNLQYVSLAKPAHFVGLTVRGRQAQL